MRKLSIALCCFFLTAAFVLAGAIAAAPVFTAAGQVGGTTTRPAQTAPPVAPLVGKPQPLVGPIQMAPLKVTKLLKPEPPAVTWEHVMDCPHCRPGEHEATNEYEEARRTLRMLLPYCSTKNYSVQDQQAAGCKGSDIIDQCMEKLYDHCMSAVKRVFPPAAEKELAEVHKLVQRAQAYERHVEYLLNTYGK